MTGYRTWQLARTTEACQTGACDDCAGTLADPDGGRTRCLCDCGHHERGRE